MADQKYPEGHFVGKWMGIGIALGTGFGIPLGFIIGNPAFFGIGLPIGLAIGLAIGSAKEKEAKEKGLIRSLTKDEKKMKNTALYAGLAIGVLLFIIVLAIYLMR